MTTPHSPNKLLAALSPREYGKLLPILRTVRLASDAPLPHCGDIRVYFPGTGMCSMTSSMADGALIEIAAVGNEGLVGLPTLTGEISPRRHRFIQIADGTAQWMPLIVFERELMRGGALRELVDRFSRVFLETMIQAAACNRLHNLTERCARWLLTTHDRVGRAKFELAPDTLARVLGVKPARLEPVIIRFERMDFIKQDSHSLTIFDAVGLKRLTCSCYHTLKRGYTEAQPTEAQPGDEAKLDKRRVALAQRAKVLVMRAPSDTACMLCGCTNRLPHKSDHECILALDDEIKGMLNQMKTLRKTRTNLLARRLSMYRSFLKNSGKFA